MLRALEICTSSKTDKDTPSDLEEYRPSSTSNTSGTPLHGGLQGQKHHIIPARGNFLSSREENVPDSVFKDSIVEPSMCGPQPEQNGTVMGERSRPPATATDIKGILPTCGIKPVGDGTVRLKLIVEDATWPEYALFDSRSWSSHQRHLEPDASRPGISVNITKTEIRGPKTSPYAVYIMHIRTAFSVRGLARRFSEFRELDLQLRVLFSSLPPLPGRRVFGSLSAPLVAERRRHLQRYLDNILSDEEVACCEPVLTFLQVHGHETEEKILFRSSQDIGKRIWDMPAGAPTEGVEQLLDNLVARQDKRQVARTQNCLGLMYAENCAQEKAIPMMQAAIETCRQGLSEAKAEAVPDGDDESMGEVEFWTTGLIACIANLGCILTKTGQLQGALERFREGVAVGGELGDIGSQANCLGKISMVLASKGDIHGAVKVGAGAMEMWETSGDHERMAAMSIAMAAMHLSRGEVKQAVERLESSLLQSRKARDKIGLAEGLHALGTCFARIGYHAHALDHLHQALALCREIGDRIGEARCLCVLGYVLMSQYDYKRCLEHYDTSLRLFDAQGDIFGQVACHEGMAKARRAMGEEWLADAHMEEAAAIKCSRAAASLSVQDFSRDIVDSPRRPALVAGHGASPQTPRRPEPRHGLLSHAAHNASSQAEQNDQALEIMPGCEQEELLGGRSRNRRSRKLAGDQGNDEGDAEEIPSGSSTPTLPHRQEDADLSAHHVHSPQTANGFSKASNGTRLVTLTEQVRASEFMAGHDDP